jgi:hypothetical protein
VFSTSNLHQNSQDMRPPDTRLIEATDAMHVQHWAGTGDRTIKVSRGDTT